MGNNVIFLDYDGVILLGTKESGGAVSKMSPEALMRVDRLRLDNDAKIVVSSDLRHESKCVLAMCEPYLPIEAFHPRCYTTPSVGLRWLEITRWLEKYPADQYVILDDRRMLFDGAPKEMRHRLVLCNNRFGLTESAYKEADMILKGRDAFGEPLEDTKQ